LLLEAAQLGRCGDLIAPSAQHRVELGGWHLHDLEPRDSMRKVPAARAALITVVPDIDSTRATMRS
jgi:hypothetical protein